MTKFFLLVLLGLAGVAAWAWSSGHRVKKQLAQQKEHEDARLKAEAKRLAEEKKSARLAAEIKAQEDARLKAEVEAKRLAEELRLAEANAKAEAQAREDARLKAEAEAQAKSEARLAAEAEAKRVAEERRQAEADEKTRLAAEEEAQRLKEETAKDEETLNQPAEEANPEPIPPSKPRDYRPLAPVSPTTRQGGGPTRTNRQPQNVSLELRLQIDFGRDGGVKTLALVPERRDGMPKQIEIEGSRRNEWNDNYYDAVPAENLGDCLQHNVEWRGRSGTRFWRWVLSRREIHVLASGDVSGLYQFGSVPCLVLDADHAVLAAVSLREDVEAALGVAGCSNFMVLDETTPGVPSGWLLFRDVKPTRAVQRRDEAHILNALCPLRDIMPHYVGGIRLTRRTWLAGFPPRIHFTGELEESFSVMIDGHPAQRAPDGAFEATGWDDVGPHDLWYGDGRETFALETIDENWERWHAHDFGTGAAICGGSIHHVAGARWQQVRVPVSNPLLVGARPGEVFFCVMRGDVRCEFVTVLVPFTPVWALPPDPAFANKQTSRIVLLNSADPIPLVEIRNANSGARHSVRAWISTIRRAGCKQLALETETNSAKDLWRNYRNLAKHLAKQNWRAMQ